MSKKEYTKLETQPKTRVVVFEAIFDAIAEFPTDMEEILNKMRETGYAEIVDEYFIFEDPDEAYTILRTRAVH